MLSRGDAEAAGPGDSLQERQKQMHTASSAALHTLGLYMTGGSKYYRYLANYIRP